MVPQKTPHVQYIVLILLWPLWGVMFIVAAGAEAYGLATTALIFGWLWWIVPILWIAHGVRTRRANNAMQFQLLQQQQQYYQYPPQQWGQQR